MERLQHDLAGQRVELDAQQEERAGMDCQGILKQYSDKIGRFSEDRLRLLANCKSSQDETMLAVTQEVVEAVKGNLQCFHYSQKKKAEQELFVYTGTHWKRVNQQDFQDFVSQCARQTGIPGKYLCRPSFINGLFEQIAVTLMKGKEEVKHGDVWINFRNCTLCIQPNGKKNVREHRPEDYFMYVLPYDYDPNAICPRFEVFLQQILPNKDTRQLLREYVASSFVREFHDEAILNCVGDGSNGKSTLFYVLQQVFGEENYSEVTLSDLCNNDERRARIEYKLLNFSEEADPHIDNSMFKRLASHQAVTIEQKYKDSREMTDYARIICACNKLPEGESNYAFYRRNIIIPFNVVIPREKADKQLRYKLRDERPGIFNWLIECLPTLMERQGYTPCKEADDALESYMVQMDSVRMFYHRCKPNEEYPTPSSDLFSLYTQMCYAENIKRTGRTNFFLQIEKLMGKKRIMMHGNKFSFPITFIED